MKITSLDVWPLSIAYKHNEVSAIINRGGVSDVIVRIGTDNGLVGWGECTCPGDTESVAAAARSAEPFLLGRNPWQTEAIWAEYNIAGNWQFQPMTRNFAFAGIDMALWDICGKAAGVPLYKLFGGAARDAEDYFYYLHWAAPDELAAECEEGVRRGYTVFYIKIGVDEKREEAMLEAVRSAIGKNRKIRIDVNQAWSMPQAVRLINRWDKAFSLDFVEAPILVDPIEATVELRRRVSVPLSANEGLWREADALRVIGSHSADYLCISPYWVGSLRRLNFVIHAAHHNSQLVVKHTHGEYGLAAAAGHHMMIAAPNAADGHQQTAQVMADDILTERLPIADGPHWGRIEKPGLGVDVDDSKLMTYHEAYLREGEYVTWGTGFKRRS